MTTTSTSALPKAARSPAHIMKMDPIDLSEIESNVIVRNIQAEDFRAIEALQLKCFPGMKPWTSEELASQCRVFPEGQFCVEYDGKIVASCSSLMIDFDDYGEDANFQKISANGLITNHNPHGDSMYGIEIMVDPDYRGMKLARRLYDARKEFCRERNLKRIVIGGRIPSYALYRSQMSAAEYVEKVVRRAIFDPVLTVQLANGFTLRKLIRSYMEDDTDSSGYATLLEWVNLEYEKDIRDRVLPTQHARVCAVQYQIRSIESFDDFAKHCHYFVDVASNYKSDFVVFPETFTCQMLSFIPERNPALAVRKLAHFTSDYLELFSDLAVKFDINIIGGSHLTLEEDCLYNIAYLFRRDGTIEKQYKLHIGPSEEHWWGVRPGKGVHVFDTDVAKIAIILSNDIGFPEMASRATEQGAEIIFVPFCTDERYGYMRVRYSAQARAVENQAYVVIAGAVGNLPSVENMDIQYAQSGIFTPSDFAFPSDAIGCECAPNIETVLVHDLDLSLLKSQRRMNGWATPRSRSFQRT